MYTPTTCFTKRKKKYNKTREEYLNIFLILKFQENKFKKRNTTRCRAVLLTHTGKRPSNVVWLSVCTKSVSYYISLSLFKLLLLLLLLLLVSFFFLCVAYSLRFLSFGISSATFFFYFGQKPRLCLSHQMEVSPLYTVCTYSLVLKRVGLQVSFTQSQQSQQGAAMRRKPLPFHILAHSSICQPAAPL